METRTYKVYKFKELPEDVQEKAIDGLYDINVDFPWYDSDLYGETAKKYGITINMRDVTFDLDRENFVAFDTFDHSYSHKTPGAKKWVCPIAVMDEKKFCKVAGVKHREEGCITIDHHHHGGGCISNFVRVDEYTSKEEEKLQAALEEMLSEILDQLHKDYDYLTSRAAIMETIEANDYDFTEDGKID